jgi:sigma-E factor negative regulatory protein RseC
MISRRGFVSAIEGGRAHISVASVGCSSCGHAGGCGIGQLAGRRRETILTLPATGLHPGQAVSLELDESRVVRAALLGYLLPAVLLLAGAVAGERAGMGEPAAALGALAGLTIGLLMTRLRRPLTPTLNLETDHG